MIHKVESYYNNLQKIHHPMNRKEKQIADIKDNERKDDDLKRIALFLFAELIIGSTADQQKDREIERVSCPI